VDSVNDIYQRAYRLQEDLNFIYLQRFEKYRSFRERSGHLYDAETSRLNDSLKKVELLGAKLDYELRVLESKVEDVEDGLQQFERYVIEIESRIQDLVKNEESKDSSWLSWVGRMFGRIQ
jgi:predicted nuclease with TOPRIM domain